MVEHSHTHFPFSKLKEVRSKGGVGVELAEVTTEKLVDPPCQTPGILGHWKCQVGESQKDVCKQEVCLFKEQLDSNPYFHSEKLYDYPSYILIRVWEIHFLEKFQKWF